MRTRLNRAMIILLMGAAGAPGLAEEPSLWQAKAVREAASPAQANSKSGIAMSAPEIVVPSAGLPAEIRDQNANNNLDVVVHDRRVFLAFRTAPSHFASPKATLYVISSADERVWEYEAQFNLETDLREPRFLSFDGRLFLYFGVLGAKSTSFEPQGAKVVERKGPGKWTAPEKFYESGFMPWRAKTLNGKAYMLGYTGGANIYNGKGSSLDVHWLTTADGRNWRPVVEGQPVVLRGGTSETDFVFMDDGALIAVSRDEEGDEMGWGSKICRAEPGDLGHWRTVLDPKKYDSPLLFKHGSDVYLIGRRNVTDSGDYQIPGFDGKPHEVRTRAYQADFWKQPKRTSLWKVDPAKLSVEFVMDLPSKGDTCFPGLIQADKQTYVIYNYTSPLDGDDVSWLKGQSGQTLIYRVALRFP